MSLKFMRREAVVNLKKDIENNLKAYRSGNFDFLLKESEHCFATEIEGDADQLTQLILPDKDDAYNSRAMFEAFPSLTPYLAADERLWVLISHTSLLEYGRARWPIPKKNEDAVKHIATHFFASSRRNIERDNVGSRLWWMGYLCSRVDGLPLDRALEVLMFRTDVRANIIERPTTSQSIPVFSAIIRKLADSYTADQSMFERNTFRGLMSYLNSKGGYQLLDAMTRAWIEQEIDKFLATTA